MAKRSGRWRQASGEIEPISVVGCGNWLMRSDRVGPRVLEWLGRRPLDGVALRDVGTTGLGLLDQLWGQELLVLVDASVGLTAKAPVRRSTLDLAAPLAQPSNIHQIGPREALAIARELYPERLPRRIVVIEVASEGLSEIEEMRACRAAVTEVERTIEEHRARFGSPTAPRSRRERWPQEKS